MSCIVATSRGTFVRATTSESWATDLARFMSLLDEALWSRRVRQLIADAERSPYGAKIVVDHHWLELALYEQSAVVAEAGKLCLPISMQAAAALTFASIAVGLHEGLSAVGQRVLKGRLRDAIKTGFAGLFLELDLASMLLDAGCEVGFPDFEGRSNYDLDVICGETEMAFECKSVSVDAGRKVRRRDFYRFITMIEGDLTDRSHGRSGIVVVTMTDRFPADSAQQRQIAKAVLDAIDNPEGKSFRSASFNVHREPITVLISEMNDHDSDFSKACHDRFGHSCHVAGALYDDGGYLIVVRSEREDDASRASLDARKSALKQLPPGRPSIVALQYEEITAQDLSSPDFRRRATLLDNVIFHDNRAAHIAAIYHCAFDGLWVHEGQLAKPAFASWSTQWHNLLKDNPLARGVSNTRFAELLGTEEHDPDDHTYGFG